MPIRGIQPRFRSVFDEVVVKHIPYILTRGSRPEAVLISYEDFLRFQELEETQVLAQYDQLVARMAGRNEEFSDDEVAANIAAARAELQG